MSFLKFYCLLVGAAFYYTSFWSEASVSTLSYFIFLITILLLLVETVPEFISILGLICFVYIYNEGVLVGDLFLASILWLAPFSFFSFISILLALDFLIELDA